MKQKRRYISVIALLITGCISVLMPTLSRGGVLAPLNWMRNDTIPPADSAAVKMALIPVALDSIPLTTISFIDSLCIVSDPTQSMSSFFAELNALLNRKDTVINIVHLGDSHIQAGYYTGRAMRRLQEQFGNAGRGWIAPLKLSKVNEPDDYFIKSVIKEWVTGRCIQANRKAPIGIGAMGIQSVSPSINFDIVIGPINGAGYAFNQAVFYRCEKSMPMLPVGDLKDSVQVSLATSPAVQGIMADTFYVNCLSDSLQLQSTRRKQGTDSLMPASSFVNTYYGFQLTNGGSGLLYHAIGVNGSMFVHYTDETYLRQLEVLRPSLLVVSLGTNESFGRRFTSAEFSGQVRDFVRLVKKVLPETTLLLTTPAECYKRVTVNKKRTYVRNDNSERAAKAIVAVAEEEGIACWDLFAATGGKNSSKKWFDKKLMGRDRIHFSKEGYWDQGELFYRALMKQYNAQLAAEADQPEYDDGNTE